MPKTAAVDRGGFLPESDGALITEENISLAFGKPREFVIEELIKRGTEVDVFWLQGRPERYILEVRALKAILATHFRFRGE